MLGLWLIAHFLILFMSLRSSHQRCSVKKGVLRNFAKFTGKHLCQAAPATLLKKRLWRRCFPVNFAKFLRTPFFAEHLCWLLLSLILNFRKKRSVISKILIFVVKSSKKYKYKSKIVMVKLLILKECIKNIWSLQQK